MKNPISLTSITLLLAVSNLSAATLYVLLGSTNPTPPYATWATAATNIQQAVGTAAAGDVVVVTNGEYAGGVAVTKPLALRSVNGPQFTVINGGGTNRCVSLTNGASLSGFTLSNGYSSGGDGGGVWSANAFLTNCVFVGNSATLMDTGNGGNGGGANGGTLYDCTLTGNSVSGTYNSMVRAYSCGGGAFGCVLYNCTLAANNGHYGGGAYGGGLYNCTLTSNSALFGGGAIESTLYNSTLTGNSAGMGGGVGDMSTLYDCTLTGNSASASAGGADYSTLYNCTLTGNSAIILGGGVYNSRLYNCIVYFNAAFSSGENCDANSTLSNCCTLPLPVNGAGNITNAPLFVDYANGNVRLQSNSPCINAGNNAYVTTATDPDGNPRIAGGTVNMGAYECQLPALLDFYNWLQAYNLSTSASSVYADSDGDGMNNWQEWVCGTCPTNPLSALCLLSVAPTGTNVTVSWQSVAGVNCFLARSANLAAPFTLVATNIIGQAGTTTYGDINATGAGQFFYRVGVNSQ